MEEVLTEDLILSKISDEEIYKFYIGDFYIGTPMTSPLKEKDDNPSFSIFKPYGIKNNGRLLFKDFSMNLSGDVFFFVALLKKTSRQNALHIIDCDFKLKLNGSKYNQQIENFVRIPDKQDLHISIFCSEFTNSGLEYWNNHGISLITLNKYNVRQISGFKVNQIYYDAQDRDYFAWSISDRFKILRLGVPKNKKWRNNFLPFHVEGYTQIEKDVDKLPKKGEKFIITKALKEVMFIDEHYKIASCAATSESRLLPEKLMKVILERFDKVYLLSDNDDTGHKLDVKYQEKYSTIKIIKSPCYKNITDWFLEEPCMETIDEIKKLWQ